MLAAAFLVLTQVGEGSSPSDPIVAFRSAKGDYALVVQREDTAFVTRERGFDSHLVLWNERTGKPIGDGNRLESGRAR